MPCSVDFIENFYQWYKSIFVELNITLSIIGVLTNLINVAAFTRKRLKSPTALIMSATALADAAAAAVYARMAWYAYVYTPGYPMDEVYTHHAALERLYCRHLFILFYNISIWLQVVLAMWRFLAVYYPLHCRSFCDMRKTYWIVSLCYVLSIVLFIPRFVSEVQLEKATDKTWPSIQLYRIKFIDDFMRSLHYRIQTILFQFVPCVVLTVFTVGLVLCLLKSDKKRKSMVQQSSNNSGKNGSSNKNFSETEKTTKMLTVVLFIFWTIEALVGVVSFLRSFGGSYCYVYVITFADTLRLANIAFKITIYYVMSRHYRKAIHSLFRCNIGISDSVATTTSGRTTETYSLQGYRSSDDATATEKSAKN